MTFRFLKEMMRRLCDEANLMGLNGLLNIHGHDLHCQHGLVTGEAIKPLYTSILKKKYYNIFSDQIKLDESSGILIL
jgi:hypothetical protein